MRRTRINLLATALAAAVLAIAHAAAPRPAGATTGLHIYGMSNLGETCSGICGPQNICCKITVVTTPP
ncbi:hypothetical protein SAMN05216486_10381 [bacterium JGI 053]|nr:hypothetical protein SAMN05216486_10381 [bacterium JGI 053]